MCGIVGAFSLDGRTAVDRGVIETMNATLIHRGPDSSGVFEDGGHIGLAMRRLAIIDVAGGDQPIANEDESIWVVFNGEIYNFATLRGELEHRGHRFATYSDTEVLVHGYEEWGDAFVTRLRGMFAFALWDSRRHRLLLARDRVGIKQLFYAKVGEQLIFGSEIKALLAHPRVERHLRPGAVNQFLTYLYVPEPMTMFAGIDELRAGHLLVAERGAFDVRPYWQLRYDPDPTMSLDDAAEGLRHHLDEAVRVRLVSEVPLGAFLSGGVDSGSVVALMAKHSNSPVKTFSVGYASGGEEFDERVFARELAEHYQTEHYELEMKPDVVEIAERLVRAFDQPHADSSAIPNWYLSRFTREHVTVALSGLGGDEIAAGYERHRGAILAEHLRWLPRWMLQGLIQPIVERLPDPSSGNQWPQRAKRFVRAAALPFDERFFEMLAQLSRSERSKILTPEVLEQIELDDPAAHYHELLRGVDGADPLNRALFADLRLYVPGDLLTLTDRISMAHSLEVRVPFLDHELLEFAARIPPAYKLRRMERKHILKRAVADLLPREFFRRRKMGFTPPLTVWFRNELRDFVEDTLNKSAISQTGVFRYDAVRQILDAHFDRRANFDNQIWALITFTLWHERYLEG